MENSNRFAPSQPPAPSVRLRFAGIEFERDGLKSVTRGSPKAKPNVVVTAVDVQGASRSRKQYFASWAAADDFLMRMRRIDQELRALSPDQEILELP